MSNPLKARSTSLTTRPDDTLPVVNVPMSELRQGKLGEVLGVKDLTRLNRELAMLDMGDAPSFYLKAESCVDARVRNSKAGQALALADSQGFSARLRSTAAKKVAAVGYDHLPDEGFSPFTKAAVAQATGGKAYFCGDTRAAIGRLQEYYPRSGARYQLRPISEAEAVTALFSNGIAAGDDCHPRHLYDENPARALRVNVKASNGYPTLGKFDGEAVDLVVQNYEALRQEFEELGFGKSREEHSNAVTERVWNMGTDPKTLPYVACQGKVKADMYAVSKVREAKLRFYNVLPRAMAFLMMEGTQTVEACADNVLTKKGVHTFSGVTLNYGGADRLVEALEEQLWDNERAFVHMGDDSWVCIIVHPPGQSPKLVMFALDCSSFDLTQHSAVTEEVHKALRDRLLEIDPVAAGVWFAYARQRVVVTLASIAKVWRHAGPSGMPMQSKINGMIMDVAIRRVLAAIPREWNPDEGELERILKQECSALGLVVKLEQYFVTECSHRPIHQALVERPFLYVGYYFYNERGMVQAYCDLPRSMAGLLYPTAQWLEKGHLQAHEAVRIASIVATMGVPPKQCEAAAAAMRELARKGLSDAVAQGLLLPDSAREESPWVILNTSAASLYQRLTQEGINALWNNLPEQLEDIPSEDVKPLALACVKSKMRRRDMVLRRQLAPREHGSAYCAEVHAPTRFNAGRPPFTVYWGPDKAPTSSGRPGRELGGRHRKGGRRGEYNYEEEYYSDDSGDSYGELYEMD